MRRLAALLLLAVLLPAGAAAQGGGGPPAKNAPVRMEPGVITLDQAKSAALGRVGQQLQANSIEAWNGKPASGLTVTSASQSNLGGRAAYIVAVMMMKSTGIVRVTVDARTGAIIESRAASWDWGNAPAWFKAGLNSPPPAKQ